MGKKFLLLLAVVGLVAAAMAPAQAAQKATALNVDATVKIATLETTGSPPVSGTANYAGRVSGSLGNGAIIGQNVFGPTVGEFTGTLKTFFNKGTIKGTLKGKGTLNQDGSVTFTGSGEFTKATGKYKGGTGRFTFTGSEPAPNSPTLTFVVDGKLKF